jgi:ribosome-binding factor A
MSRMRPQKVASAIKRELAHACLYESENPLFREVVITNVEVSKDLRVANVYYTNYLNPGRDRKNMELQLRKASPHFIRLLRSRLSMKYFPELRFHYDTSIERMEKIDTILREIDTKE